MKQNSAYDFDLMDVLSPDDLCEKVEEPSEQSKTFRGSIEFYSKSVDNSSQEAIGCVKHHINAIFLAQFGRRCKIVADTLCKGTMAPKLKFELPICSLNVHNLLSTMTYLSRIPGVNSYVLAPRVTTGKADMLRRVDYYNYRNAVSYINRSLDSYRYELYADDNGRLPEDKELSQEDKEYTRYFVWRAIGRNNFSVNEHIIKWFLSNAEQKIVGDSYKSISAVEKMTLNPEKINDVMLYIVRMNSHGDLYIAPEKQNRDWDMAHSAEDIKAEEERDVRISEDLKQHFIDNLDNYPCYAGFEIYVKHKDYTWYNNKCQKMYGAYFCMVYDGRQTGFCFALMMERFDEKERTRHASRDFKSYFKNKEQPI